MIDSPGALCVRVGEKSISWTFRKDISMRSSFHRTFTLSDRLYNISVMLAGHSCVSATSLNSLMLSRKVESLGDMFYSFNKPKLLASGCERMSDSKMSSSFQEIRINVESKYVAFAILLWRLLLLTVWNGEICTKLNYWNIFWCPVTSWPKHFPLVRLTHYSHFPPPSTWFSL